ncbi:hypothetical protein TNCV_1353911 [Trichonephila clavipes]|nr:hypothetical protein TNCV_1353911 [Trichonephila clavipes]
MPPSTHGVRALQTSGSESLVDGRSRNHGCRGWRILPSPPVPCLNCGEMETGGVAICRNEVQPVSCSGNFHSFPTGRT